MTPDGFRIIQPKPTLKPGMTLDEVVQFCKAHPEEVGKTELGRTVLRLIKQGNGKRLKRFWLGMR